jgi:PleD family two-component response regulator
MALELSRKTIILVDDIGFHLMSVKDRLKSHYKVYPAQSVEILFDILLKVMPDLILMDLNMPEVDGFEAMEKLNAIKHYKNIPVIVLSSSKERKGALHAMNLGAADFVAKPFTDTDLIESIELQLDPEKKAKLRPVVLAVDDDPSILKTVSFQLGERYKVHTLPNPNKIKMLLNSLTPDLFLLDYNMPGCSGFDLVPIIRSLPEHTDTPIVYLTTEGTEDKITTAAHLGASGFILKPVDGKILREKVAQNLKDYIIRRRIRRF